MKKLITLFLSGGLGYCLIEVWWRGYTHWTMFILGGACFYLLYSAFYLLSHLPVAIKAIIGGGIITVAEFVTGCIVNICFKMNVWNYSDAPYNLLGQICLPYTLIWMLLSVPIALLFELVGEYVR